MKQKKRIIIVLEINVFLALKLSELRDWLLPMFMNGLVRVTHPDTSQDSYEHALHRHRKLNTQASKQIKLKKKLERIFKHTYFGIHIGLVAFWLEAMFVFWKMNHINNLEDFLNYFKASILLVISLNFLTFGKLTNFNEFLSRIKIRTENWIYGKYITLDERIEKTSIEKQDLQIKLNQLNDSTVNNIEIGANA